MMKTDLHSFTLSIHDIVASYILVPKRLLDNMEVPTIRPIVKNGAGNPRFVKFEQNSRIVDT